MSTPPVPRVTIVTGGPTLEYKSSLDSALGILDFRASLHGEFQLEPCFITSSGQWLDTATSNKVLDRYRAGEEAETTQAEIVEIIEGGRSVQAWEVLANTEVVFPTICGAFGEDGLISGLCQALRKAYVGASVWTSVVQYDKVTCNAVLKGAGIIQTSQFVILPGDKLDLNAIEERVPLPWVVKPSDGGCSVGISVVRAASELPAAWCESRRYYPRSPTLVESMVEGALEIDVVVMKDLAGEVVATPCGMFVSPSPGDAESSPDPAPIMQIPPSGLSLEDGEEMQRLAIRVYRVLRGSGWLKVDFFYNRETSEILVSEVNAVPNMSRGSMLWQLWDAAGVAPADLVRRVIKQAMDEAGSDSSIWATAKLWQGSLVGRGRVKVE